MRVDLGPAAGETADLVFEEEQGRRVEGEWLHLGKASLESGYVLSGSGASLGKQDREFLSQRALDIDSAGSRVRLLP